MAKWTGKVKVIRRWFRSPKYLLQFEIQQNDLDYPDCQELYWWEVDINRLDLIAFDLQCLRSENRVIHSENKRLREKLVNIGSDTKER